MKNENFKIRFAFKIKKQIILSVRGLNPIRVWKVPFDFQFKIKMKIEKM